MPSRDESNYDRAERETIRNLRPPPKVTIAIERENNLRTYSRSLVNDTLEREQQQASVRVPIQKVPGEIVVPPYVRPPKGAKVEALPHFPPTSDVVIVPPKPKVEAKERIGIHPLAIEGVEDNVKETIGRPYIHMRDGVETMPLERTTVEDRIKEREGRPIISAKTKKQPLVQFIKTKDKDMGLFPIRGEESAFGLPTEQRIKTDSPVTYLNWLDRFFNWLNALLKGD